LAATQRLGDVYVKRPARQHAAAEELGMSTIPEISEAASKSPHGRRVDFKLEAVVIPVSDVDRSKSFYSNLGWRLDADFAVGDSFRVVQFTPPGSPASIHFGKD
jgi:hypothetical protein